MEEGGDGGAGPKLWVEVPALEDFGCVGSYLEAGADL